MTNYFTDMFNKAIQSGLDQSKVSASRDWFTTQTSNVRKVEPRTIIGKSQDTLVNKITIGRMYLFIYDAKTKDVLPYFDRFPLIFPFQKSPQGFYGINMHYLPYMLRAKLMDALYDVLNNDKMDQTSKLRLNYSILKGASKYRFFEPCIKQYLNTQVKSRFLYVDPKQWETALFLPLERFVGATKTQVWKDSRKRIGI